MPPVPSVPSVGGGPLVGGSVGAWVVGGARGGRGRPPPLPRCALAVARIRKRQINFFMAFLISNVISQKLFDLKYLQNEVILTITHLDTFLENTWEDLLSAIKKWQNGKIQLLTKKRQLSINHVIFFRKKEHAATTYFFSRI